MVNSLSLSQNTALFSLLGTTYGGDGRSTFGLPNLQASIPIHQGQGPGLSSYSLGETGGQTTHTLTTQELPLHNHTFNGGSGSLRGDSGSVSGNCPNDTVGVNPYSTAASNATMSPQAVAPAATNQPHDNLQPYLVLNFIIALQGIFPSRN